MPGLLQEQMPQGQMPQGQPPQGQPPEQGDEQEMYNVLVEAMLGYLYAEGMENVERELQMEENPVFGMAIAMEYIMVASVAMLQERGKTIPPQVMVQAGMELADNIGQIADAMGLVSIEDDLAIEMAFFIALDSMADDIMDEPPGIRQQYKQIAETLRNERMAMMDPNDLPPEVQQELMAAEQAPAQQPAQEPMAGRGGY